MEDRVAQLLDKQDIYELSCKYMRGLDRLDEQLLLSVFSKTAGVTTALPRGHLPSLSATASRRCRGTPMVEAM